MSNRATSPVGDQPHGFDERVQPFATNGGSVEERADVDLMVVLRHLWRSRWFVIIAAIAGVVFALAAFLGFRTIGPAETSYNSAIVVTFPSREAGTYPNGVAFSPTDLLSPAVLSEVHDRNQLDTAGVSLDAFLSLVAVSPYSPLADSVSERYRAKLGTRNISFEERRALEAEFAAQLAAVSNHGVLITLQIPSTSPITEDMARKILADIPTVWSDVYINRLGAVAFGAAVSGGALVDENLLQSLDYPLQYDYLEQHIDKASARIDQIAKLPGATSLQLTGSGKSIADLRRELDTLEDFSVVRALLPLVDQGLSRAPEQTVLSYRNAIRQLQFSKRASDQRVEAVSEVLRDVERPETQGASVGANPTAAESFPTVTQIDGALIDRVIDLSSRGPEFGFRRELLDGRLTIQNTSINVAGQIDRLTTRIQAIEAFSPSDARLKESADVFTEGVRFVSAALNGIWDETNRLHTELGTTQLSQDKLLYKPASLEEDVRVSQTSLMSMWSIGFVITCGLVGALLGFFAYLWRVNARPTDY